MLLKEQRDQWGSKGSLEITTLPTGAHYSIREPQTCQESAEVTTNNENAWLIKNGSEACRSSHHTIKVNQKLGEASY